MPESFPPALVIDREPRAKLRFKGPQALWFLDQLLTNKLDDLQAGSGREALLLTPTGKIKAAMRVLLPAPDVLLDVDGTDGENADRLAEELVKFFQEKVFTTQVEVEDARADHRIISVLGPDAPRVVNDALQRMSVPQSEHGCSLFADGFLVGVERPVPGVEIWVRPEQAEDVMDRLLRAGGTSASPEALSRLQTLHGVQVARLDFDDTFLPQEAALERAVSFDKGCYLGQEAVAMTQRGRVKRRLRHLHSDDKLTVGDVEYEGAVVGSVSRIASSDLGGRAIASIKTSVPLGAEVSVAGTSAEVTSLPGSPEGPAVPSARELRERLQQAAPPI